MSKDEPELLKPNLCKNCRHAIKLKSSGNLICDDAGFIIGETDGGFVCFTTIDGDDMAQKMRDMLDDMQSRRDL